MPPHSVPVDKDGFPLPRKLSSEPAPRAPRELRPAPAWAKAAAGMLLVGGIALLAALPAWRRGGGPGLARLRMHKADAQFQDGDVQGALRLLDKAHAAAPEDADVVLFRGWMRLQAGDLAGSLHDLNRVQQSHPRAREVYTRRSQVYQRLGRHAEAIADATEALALAHPSDPEPYNNRAYVRAIAGVELEGALDDVQRAIEFGPQPNAAYLDTRGYIYHLLNRQAEALEDLDQAIRLAEAEGPWGLRPNRARHAGATELDLRLHHEQLSVLYHHRGLVHKALGHEEQAQRDLAKGQELGYNPEAGVY